MTLSELQAVIEDMIAKDPINGNLDVVVSGYEGGYNSVTMVGPVWCNPFANDGNTCFGQHGDGNLTDPDPPTHLALEIKGAPVTLGEAFSGTVVVRSKMSVIRDTVK